jgi:hypothetical protein
LPALVFAAQNPYPGRKNFLIAAQAASKPPPHFAGPGHISFGTKQAIDNFLKI